MRHVTSIEAMRAWSAATRREGSTIALVPTMGALHEGHLSLVRIAREHAARVVASIFVNPTQFDSPGDFRAYPRDEARDLELLEREGVDVTFLPTTEEMYPDGFQTRVEVTGLSQPLCGVHRPGHFAGVTTVVAKLFQTVRPGFAVFGEKDFQQLQVIRRMVRDLHFDLEILPGPIVREEDGLAMSSRNRRLDAAWRPEAAAIPRGLAAARELFESGERRASAFEHAFRDALAGTRLRVEYAEVRDPDTLGTVEEIAERATLAVAVWAGDVRLIDNQTFQGHPETARAVAGGDR